MGIPVKGYRKESIVFNESWCLSLYQSSVDVDSYNLENHLKQYIRVWCINHYHEEYHLQTICLYTCT